MSAPTDRSNDPNDLAFYAPKGGRSVRLSQVSAAATALMTTSEPEHIDKGRMVPLSASAELFDDPAIQRLRENRSIDPELVPVPRSVLDKRSWPGQVARLVMFFLAAAVVAHIVTGWPFPATWLQEARDRGVDLVQSSTPSARPSKTGIATEVPRLLVRQSRGFSGEPVSLGVMVLGRVDGAAVVVTGLIPGMTLSVGNPMGTDAWQIPANSEILSNAWIIPPKDFLGAVELAAELRLADTTVAHRQPIHLEWVAEAPAIAAVPPELGVQSSSVTPSRQDAPAKRQLDREEIALLIQRGREFIASGDLVAARVLLQRAAESNDAEAALSLAATYDPLVLRELKVYGIAADVAMARTWYEKAKQFGSAEAPRRLEALVAAIR